MWAGGGEGGRTNPSRRKQRNKKGEKKPVFALGSFCNASLINTF
jgi:hypothetical protein